MISRTHKDLRISKDVSLPRDVITQTIAILAKRRAGKSYTMRKLVEQLLANHEQVVLVDPKGDQWGLRSSADGKKKGYPIVILGGEHGDAPLEAEAGEVVAKLVVEERVSVLLDLSLFSKGQVARFMAVFLEQIYRLKAQEKYRTPMMVVIDEADAIAPQKPQRGEERMLGAADDIVRRGGQRGIGCALITQRSAVLNKNVLTQAQVLIVLRTIAPQDLSAMKAWIDVHGTDEQGKEMMSSLPSLPIGDAYFWSPGWPTDEGIFKRTHILPIETFDSGATPAPGMKRIIPKNLADVDLEVLKKQMSATIEKAKENDPKALKKRIADLELAAKKAPAGQPLPTGTPERISSIVEKELKKRDAEWKPKMDAANKEIGRLSAIIGKIAKLAGGETYAVFTVPDIKIPKDFMKDLGPGDVMQVPSQAEPLIRPVDTRLSDTVDNVGISGPEQRILNGIAWMNAIGVREPNRVAVAFLSDYSSNSSGYVKACGSLRTKGYVEYLPGNLIVLTDAGRELAHVIDPPSSNSELHEKIYSRLSPREKAVLEPIVNAAGDQITKSDVAAQSDYSENSSGYVKILGKLRTLGLIDYAPGGYVKAESILFPANPYPNSYIRDL